LKCEYRAKAQVCVSTYPSQGYLGPVGNSGLTPRCAVGVNDWRSVSIHPLAARSSRSRLRRGQHSMESSLGIARSVRRGPRPPGAGRGYRHHQTWPKKPWFEGSASARDTL